MMIAIPFIYFLLANASMVIITKKPFGKVLPLTFILNILILLISGLVFSTFNIGFIINILFALYSFYYLVKNKDKRDEFKKNYLSNGFYAFIVLFIIAFLFDFNRVFSHWDEYSHWGEMVKEMFRLDKLYSVEDSVLQAHKDYPPGISIFELFWCKLMGGYRESTLITSLHIFEFSLFIPAISEKIKFKNVKSLVINSIIGIVLIFVSISFFDLHGVINSIYTDYIMAIILAYAIFTIIFEKKLLSNYFIFSLSLVTILMMLTKQMGLPFYMMIMYVYIIKIIYNKEFKKENKKQFIKVLLYTIILPLLVWKGWDLYVSSMYTLQQFKLSDIKLSKLYGIIKGTQGEVYQITAANNYLKALKEVNISSSVVRLTYIKSIFLALILMYITYRYGRKYIDKKDFLNLESIIIFGSIGYAFIMLTLYVFNFGEIEGPNIASYDRYMDTYLIFCVSLIIMIFIRIFSIEYKKRKFNLLLLITLIIFIFIDGVHADKYKPVLKHDSINIYERCANVINKYTKDKNVYIIAQDSVGDFQYIVKYYANPINVNLKYFNLKKENVSDEYRNKIKNKILKYDYLFLARSDDKFKENYGSLFENEDDIENECMYEIKDNKIILKGC